MKRLLLAALFGSLAVTSAFTGCKQAPAPEPQAATALAITPACAKCETQAIGSCQTQLAACEKSPACGQVAVCVAGCGPNDVQCLQACAKNAANSKEFADLATCLVCDNCAMECQGAWNCPGGGGGGGQGGGGVGGGGGKGGGGVGGQGAGGAPGSGGAGGAGGGGTCDNAGMGEKCDGCEKCLDCSLNGPCAQQLKDCLADASCADIASCAQGCDDQQCIQDCEGQGNSQKFQDLLKCSVCAQCTNSCDGKALGCP